MKRKVKSRDALKAVGIVDLASLREWAQRHGLLIAFILYVPKNLFVPAYWHVIPVSRKFYGDKDVAEDNAKEWASAHYNVDEWVRLEGLGNLLIPDTIADELSNQIPNLVRYRKRQHT